MSRNFIYRLENAKKVCPALFGVYG